MIIDFNKNNGGGGGEYVLPKATATKLGGIKVGENLSIDANGVLSAQGGEGKKTLNITVRYNEDEEKWFADADEFAAALEYLKENGADSADVIITSYQESEEVPYILKPTIALSSYEGETYLTCIGYFLDNTQYILDNSLEFVLGDAVEQNYKLVPELPEWANEGTMAYLWGEQNVYEDVEVPLGYVFNFDDIRMQPFAHIMQYYEGGQGPDEHGWMRYGEGSDWNHIWFNSDYTGNVDIYEADGWKEFWNCVARYDENEQKFYIGFVNEASIEGSDGFFLRMEDGVNYDTFNSYQKIVKTYKPGQYIFKDGEWESVGGGAGVPTITLGQYTSEEFDAVVDAYKNHKPYCIYIEFYGLYFQAEISNYDTGDNRLEIYSMFYWNNSNITYYGNCWQDGRSSSGFTGINPNAYGKTVVEPEVFGTVIPSGTAYVAKAWTPSRLYILRCNDGYDMLTLWEDGLINFGPGGEHLQVGSGWHYETRSGSECWARVIENAAGEIVCEFRYNNCIVDEGAFATYVTSTPDQPEIKIGTKLLSRVFNDVEPYFKKSIRSLDLDYLVVDDALQPKMKTLTQAEYDALETKNANTLYIIL